MTHNLWFANNVMEQAMRRERVLEAYNLLEIHCSEKTPLLIFLVKCPCNCWTLPEGKHFLLE